MPIPNQYGYKHVQRRNNRYCVPSIKGGFRSAYEASVAYWLAHGEGNEPPIPPTSSCSYGESTVLKCWCPALPDDGNKFCKLHHEQTKAINEWRSKNEKQRTEKKLLRARSKVLTMEQTLKML